MKTRKQCWSQTQHYRKALTGFAVLAVMGLSAQVQAQSSSLSIRDADQITYADHVAQIINDNCVVCHREGGIGPMQFTNYEQVRPWAPLIQYKVARREMPPYAYDHGIGIQELQGDWRLSQEEIDTLSAWVDQGAPEGDWGDRTPPEPDLPDLEEWNFADQFGQPDLIVDSAPIDIPASGNDMWHRPYAMTNLATDRCIKAIQVKPRGAAKTIVHHANSDVEVMNEDGEYEDFGQLTEYAMGKWGEIMPEGVCRTLPANSRVRWDIHIYPGGIGATAPGAGLDDNVVEIGIWLHPEGYEEVAKYKQDLKLYGLRHGDLIVPPHGTTMTQGFHSFDHPVRIDSFQPHGHLRMRAASLEIFYPATGRTEQISQVSNWSATWHHSHLYEPDVAPLVPTGAVLVIKQWYDNTADNPNNPDPDQWVVGGSRTADEMSHAWIAITHLDQEAYDQMLAEREEKQKRALASE
ncbi:MAG: cytochrome c [Pseudomonadales bacterium]|nr:cytochrome c [Pseudomonadales bacterium]